MKHEDTHHLCEVESWSIYSEWLAKIRCWLPTSARAYGWCPISGPWPENTNQLITDIVCPPALLFMERTCCIRSCGILYRIINRHVMQTNKPVMLMHRTICRMPMAMWELIAQISINQNPDLGLNCRISHSGVAKDVFTEMEHHVPL